LQVESLSRQIQELQEVIRQEQRALAANAQDREKRFFLRSKQNLLKALEARPRLGQRGARRTHVAKPEG
jgi:flagellar biosynthesis/type III secretory pathway chaperone